MICDPLHDLHVLHGLIPKSPSALSAGDKSNPPILQSPIFIFVAALLAMGGGISYNSHRFAHERVKQSDL